MSDLATIVIPLLTQVDAWLDRAVRSAVTQTAQCEVIVVTSRETPTSNWRILDEIALEHGNLRVIFRDLPRGFPQTLNFGMRAATTGRIGILLSDDWLEPECVAACLAHTADIVCAGHFTYYADGITKLEGGDRKLRLDRFLAKPTPEEKASYLTHFFLFQKDALERAGYVDETVGDFPGIDDYHLIWTMLEQNASVAIVEECLYNYRDHDGERLTMKDPEQAVRNLEKILHKHRVGEPEFSRLIEAHRRWYGKPLQEVLQARQLKSA
jgi:glycosyltransferase involved in cell wall biosynthesis